MISFYEVTIRNKYPLPRINDLFSLGEQSYSPKTIYVQVIINYGLRRQISPRQLSERVTGTTNS